MDPSPRPDRDEINYYAPPEASLREGVDLGDELAEFEATRRKYLNHEASVQSIGWLYILGATLTGLGTVGLVATVFTGQGRQTLGMGIAAVFYAGMTALNATVGVGLTRLRTWARWVAVVLTILSILVTIGYAGLFLAVVPDAGAGAGIAIVFAIATLIPAYILYLLLSAKGTMVFSPEYREVIDRTPHIKYKVSCLLRGLVYFFLAMVGLGIVGYFFKRR
jgi:hypothetical protein